MKKKSWQIAVLAICSIVILGLPRGVAAGVEPDSSKDGEEVGIAVVVFDAEPRNSEPDSLKTTFAFSDEKVLPVTPVKNQAQSGTCWCFSGIGMVECELLRDGKGEHDLSEMWIVRNIYKEKVAKYVRMHGNSSLSPGGVPDDVVYIISRYGIVPEEVYSGLNDAENHNHKELDEAIRTFAQKMVKNDSAVLATEWELQLDSILDRYLGTCPETFVYRGKEYTPKSLAEELDIDTEEYINLTSFSHHPLYATFSLEIPDNWNWSRFGNVTIEDIEAVVEASLKAGHAINWASDVSDPGFRYKDGFAVILENEDGKPVLSAEAIAKGSEQEVTITPEMRQEAFDDYRTTDDHGMLIVGTATDQNGNRFYKVKNSWGETGKYKGFFYVSKPYLLYKTTALLVHRDAVPHEVIKKLEANERNRYE